MLYEDLPLVFTNYLLIDTRGKPQARVAKACVTCHRLKTKCEERPCLRCKKRGTECIFQSTNNTNPAQALAGTSDQRFNVFLKLNTSVQAKVLPQVKNANEAQQWDYNSVLDELVRVYDNTNKREETEEAEGSLYPLRQGNDSLPLNNSLKNRVADDCTGWDGRGELQRVDQFQPTSPSQIQRGGKGSVEEQAQNNSELVDGTPGRREVRYTQQEIFQQPLEQQDYCTQDLSQYPQQELKWWEKGLGFGVTNYAELSQTNPSQSCIDTFQLRHVVLPRQGNLSSSSNSELGPLHGILPHRGAHEPMNSTLADSLHMSVVLPNMLYHPQLMYNSGPGQIKEDESSSFMV